MTTLEWPEGLIESSRTLTVVLKDDVMNEIPLMPGWSSDERGIQGRPQPGQMIEHVGTILIPWTSIRYAFQGP